MTRNKERFSRLLHTRLSGHDSKQGKDILHTSLLGLWERPPLVSNEREKFGRSLAVKRPTFELLLGDNMPEPVGEGKCLPATMTEKGGFVV